MALVERDAIDPHLIHREIPDPGSRFHPRIAEESMGTKARSSSGRVGDPLRPTRGSHASRDRSVEAQRRSSRSCALRVRAGPLRGHRAAAMRASVTRMPAARPSRVAGTTRAVRGTPGRVMASGSKKVVTYDDGWKKQFFGTGIFLEDDESKSVDVLERVQKKKLLSSVEKSGLLSLAEKSGLTLSKIEKLGLLSTAERLGLLSLLENAATTDPAVISSLSLPFLVLTVLGATLIPDDNTVEVVLKTLFCGVSFGTFGALFLGGFVVAGLQED
eukprot:scaffold1771_cov343-Pavlova_lutheri.AAC.30